MEPSEKEEIRRRIDIVDLINGYTPLKKTGRNFKGLCPFHAEKTPSFTVDGERGRWHCFGSCSTGGDVFTFLMKAESLTFPEAAERLAERAGVTITRRGADGSDATGAAALARDERDRLFAVNALAARFFRESYARARLAQDYAHKRGLAHETLDAFGVGWAPDDWTPLAEFLAKNGTAMADAEKAGLVFASKRGDNRYTDKFRGRLMFPIVDVQERVVAFGGRLLLPSPNAPKYLNSPETPVFSKSRILYALNHARKAITADNSVVVVEGYTDAIACHQAGVANVVATLGTSLTDEHVRLLGRYTQNVVLSFDADEAGVRAALRAAALFAGASGGFTLRILTLPPGEDPDSLLAKGGAAAFRKAIKTALSVSEFQLRSLQARFDIATDEGKAALLRDALPIVSQLDHELERDKLIVKLACFHPTFSTSSLRAEQTLRDEVAGLRARGHRAAELAIEGPLGQTAASAPPVQLRGEDIVKAGRRGGGGAPIPFTRSGRPAPFNAPLPPAAPAQAPLSPPRRTAMQVAEETLLRAWLSDEWTALARGPIAGITFSDATTVRLIEALSPLIEGGYSPSSALDQLTDAALLDHANFLLLGGDEAPLGEQVITEYAQALERQKHKQKSRRSGAQVLEEAGNGLDYNESLACWFQEEQAIKGGRPPNNERDSNDPR